MFYLCIGRFGMSFGRVLSVVRTLPTKTAHPRFTPHYQCVNWFKLCDWKMLGFEWFIFHRDRLLVSWNVALASLLFYKALVFYSNAQRLAFMLGWSVLWCWGNLVMQIRYILFFITQKITALSPCFFPVLCLRLNVIVFSAVECFWLKMYWVKFVGFFSITFTAWFKGW